jgi:hypothetical protein
MYLKTILNAADHMLTLWAKYFKREAMSDIDFLRLTENIQ